MITQLVGKYKILKTNLAKTIFIWVKIIYK